MTTPTELMKQKLEEISSQLKIALNNGLDNAEVNKMTNYYNSYFVALQLLDSHSELDHKVSRIFIDKQGKIDYRMVSLKGHLSGVKSDNKLKKIKK